MGITYRSDLCLSWLSAYGGQGATLQQEAQARAKSGGAPQHLLVPHTNSQTAVGIAAYKLPPGGSLEITDIYQMRQLTADEVGMHIRVMC